MKEIILFGRSLDLSNEPFAITRQINDIGELKDRQNDFSTEIILPLTNRNKTLLGSAQIMGSETDKPYRALPVSLLQNGATILPHASLILDEADDEGFKGFIVSGIYSFFSLLGEKSIKDLDLSGFDHEWTAQAASDSINNTDGYIYPIVQTGPVLPTGNTIEMKYQVPSIFFKTIVNKIFEEAGYKKTGNIFNNTTYQNILFHCNNSFEHSKEFIDARSCTIGVTRIKTVKAFNAIAGGTLDYGPALFEWNNEETHTAYYDEEFRVLQPQVKTGYRDGEKNCFKTAQNKYVAVGTYKVNVEISLPMEVAFTNSPIEIKIALRKNGTDISIDDFTSHNPGHNKYELITKKIEVEDLPMVKGDTLDMFFQFQETSSLSVGQVTFPASERTADDLGFYSGINSKNCYFKVTVTEEIAQGEELPISDLLPNIKQKDFIKAWAHMFGVIFQPDNLTRVIDCRQFKEITNSKGIDWSSKLDRSQKIQTSYRFEKYGQKNHFKYLEGEETEEKGLGDSFFNIADENLQQEVDIIELPFQASGQTKVLGGIECALVPLFTLNEDSLEWERQDIGPRIFLLKREPKQVIYTDTNLTNDLGTINAPIAYFNELQDSLHFETLLTNHYKELIWSLQKCKIARAYFYLNEADITMLDHFEKIYVEFFGLQFYLNIVEQYQGEGSTLCELVKI